MASLMRPLMRSLARPALVMFAILSLLCGVLYPLAVAAIGHLAFPHQTNGSLIEADGRTVGSILIGQPFSSPRYFWGRPSATAPMADNTAGSGGSNLGPSNPALLGAVMERLAALQQADPGKRAAVPVDLVTASASGLDPEISLAAAEYQAARSPPPASCPSSRCAR
ncbi:MAG: potassium-transporting ATPase subunit [Massilia sp.]|nr:potassium-transporting ATPase subunit [Massilia sp.]